MASFSLKNTITAQSSKQDVSDLIPFNEKCCKSIQFKAPVMAIFGSIPSKSMLPCKANPHQHHGTRFLLKRQGSVHADKNGPLLQNYRSQMHHIPVVIHNTSFTYVIHIFKVTGYQWN